MLLGKRRAAGVLIAALLLFAAGLFGPRTAAVNAHGSSPDCYGEITVEDVRAAAPTECIFHYTGLPIVVEGWFDTDHPNLRADIHVVATLVYRGGDRQTLPVECADPGTVNDPYAECRLVWDPLATGGLRTDVPMLHDEVWLICEAHTHSKESRLYDRYFGDAAGGEFHCGTGPIPGEPSSPVDVVVPTLPAGTPSFAAVPVNRYATAATVVSRDAAAAGPPVFVNADPALHDVVALDAKRADGSAGWCFQYDPGKCPLFWSRLIGAGETTQVLGFDTAPPGTYQFYCSIHPEMLGTVVVQ